MRESAADAALQVPTPNWIQLVLRDAAAVDKGVISDLSSAVRHSRARAAHARRSTASEMRVSISDTDAPSSPSSLELHTGLALNPSSPDAHRPVALRARSAEPLNTLSTVTVSEVRVPDHSAALLNASAAVTSAAYSGVASPASIATDVTEGTTSIPCYQLFDVCQFKRGKSSHHPAAAAATVVTAPTVPAVAGVSMAQVGHADDSVTTLGSTLAELAPLQLRSLAVQDVSSLAAPSISMTAVTDAQMQQPTSDLDVCPVDDYKPNRIVLNPAFFTPVGHIVTAPTQSI